MLNLSTIPRNPFPHRFAELIISSIFKRPVQDFLDALLGYLNLEHGVIVGSGREAFFYILKVLLKKGDEIIMPAFSCNVLLGPLKQTGVIPVFCDINPKSLNMELKHIQPYITNRTKAILATHQFGYPAEMDDILDYCQSKNLICIEDAAPALGAKYKDKFVGTLGDIAFFSFQESKVISTIDGGLIVGQKHWMEKLSQMGLQHLDYHSSLKYFVKSIEHYLLKNQYAYQQLLFLWGLSHEEFTAAHLLNLEESRYSGSHKTISKFQSSLGLDRLKNIDTILQNRINAASMYRSLIRELKSIIDIPQSDLSEKTHAYSRFPILVKDKNTFYREVRKEGVDLGHSFSYKLPQYYLNKSTHVPNTDWVMEHILNIPIHPDARVNEIIMERITNASKRIDNFQIL